MPLNRFWRSGRPRLHRAVRRFYDNYGFPIAKFIRSPYMADGIYLAMKPLEWLFLAVLYCTDPRPEDRIAVQYTGKIRKRNFNNCFALAGRRAFMVDSV